jgi:hypothetical protein
MIRKNDTSRQALPANAERPWMRYAGFVESGDPHSSQSIDEIVYGSEDRDLGPIRPGAPGA